MRVLKSNLHGLTVGTAPVNNGHKRASRGVVKGWTPAATRRNLSFLRSIDSKKIGFYDGSPVLGLAVTLTVKICPPTAKDWATLRRVFIERLKRLGLVRMHWVTEWQRRKVPHLHFSGWFFSDYSSYELSDLIIKSWVDLTRVYESSELSQFTSLIYDELGWFKYVAKHAARGVSHYQRNIENIPEGWKSKTGRVWGKVGDWKGVSMPICEDSLSSEEYYKLRRILRSWRVADSRKGGDKYRILSAKKMLKCNDIMLSDVRGCSEWFSQELLTKAMQHIRNI